MSDEPNRGPRREIKAPPREETAGTQTPGASPKRPPAPVNLVPVNPGNAPSESKSGSPKP